jgi:adenylylsulfate kinase-like enzyme
MKRDPKGLYAKAQLGEIQNFTGIHSTYEEPLTPDIRINTNEDSVEESTSCLIKKITPKLISS